MPPRNLTAILIAAAVSLVCYHQAVRDRYAAALLEAMTLIDQQFVDEVDSHQLFEDAMDGMVSGLDEYSSFIDETQYGQFRETLDQRFGGVGILVEVDPDTKRLTVISPMLQTPAYRAGMRSGDMILEIDGVSTEGMGTRDSVELMRGEEHTVVRLKVRRPGVEQPLGFELRREVIPVESALGDYRNPDGSWNYHLQDAPEISYIRLRTFGEDTVDELRKALERPGRGVILDLRNNAGGLLKAAVETCDLFLPEGRIVSTRSRNEIRRVYDASSDMSLAQDIPIVVLVNEFSASASEIVAACLQDHQRATIIGQRTWGKGTVQSIIEMEGGRSALKLTIASYWRPTGINIHRRKDEREDVPWGVQPAEPFRVPIDDEALAKMLEQRRQRDIVHYPDEPPVERAYTQPTYAIDPQLSRAVEHLQSQWQAAPSEASQ